MEKRIKEYRKIQNWENYFLDSAIYSIGKKLGITYELSFHGVSAITGDMFAYYYNKNKPCDSGITNYFFEPEVVKKAYKAFGYDCITFTNEAINANTNLVIDKIKESIDKEIPVLGWGMGTLPEGCLIGGYNDNALLVNLYLGPDRLPKGSIDEDGYTLKTKEDLQKSLGVFIIGDKVEQSSEEEVVIDAIKNIPALYTRKPENGYVFGKDAFKEWSNVLLNEEYFENKTDDEINNITWDYHCSPYCAICTTQSYKFMSLAAGRFRHIKGIFPLANEYFSIRDNVQMIWGLQKGFWPSSEILRSKANRKYIADCLNTIGKSCDKIVEIIEG
jgi:hypothetical protein